MTYHSIITVFSVILLYHTVTFPLPDTAPSPDTTKNIDTSAEVTISDDTLSSVHTVSDNQTRIDSVSPGGEKERITDSLASDSLRKIARRDFILGRNTYYRRIYQHYPTSIDSLYSTADFFPFRIFQADGMNLSEVIYTHPSFTPVPVALASNLNRFLFYGFPAAHVSLHPGNSLFTRYIDPTVGLNLYSGGEMKNIHFTLPGKITFCEQPSLITKPETSIFWENGVFRENILNIRFARPFAERFQIGIFSNYQSFNRKSFNHKTGGIYTFYKSIYDRLGLDSSYVSYKGTNPLTNEHVSSIHLLWTGKNGMTSRLAYKYADLHNDLATEYVTDTAQETSAFAWEKRSHYDHSVQARLSSVPLGKYLRVHTEAFLQKNANRTTPVSTEISANPVCRGESIIYGGGISPFVGFTAHDTLAIIFNTKRDETVRYDTSQWVTHSTQTAVTFTQQYALQPINLLGIAKGSIGYSFVKVNSKLESIPTWQICFTHLLGKQQLQFFALQSIFPPDIPYDTTVEILPGNLADTYQSYGTEGKLRYKKIGINLGFCYMNGVHPSSVEKAWPHQIAPYQEPRWVCMVTPLFGQWHGLSLFSQWLLSETRPFIKSKSLLSYHINKEGRTPHLFIDLGADSWSKRQPVSYAGITTWHRPILDCHLKTTVQIKTFRLFYKVDNILNSNIAYVPGYYMPGLVFRWGINWLIQG